MSSSNSPCAACKFLRRKCTQGCVFAPYFPPDNPTKFSHVHRVFGASNVAKLLNDLTPAQREDAVNSLAYEAEARIHDPVYGCVSYISALQHRLLLLQRDLFSARKELTALLGHTPLVPFPQFQGGVGIGLGLGAQQSYRDQNDQYEQHEQQQQQMVNMQQLAEAVAAAGEQEMREIERLIADGGGGGDVEASSSMSNMIVVPQQDGEREQQHEGQLHYIHHNNHHNNISGRHEGPSS